MPWYRATIKGVGWMYDGGASVPDEKTVHYEFEEVDDDAAQEKAKAYARGREIRREFFLTDPDPNVEVTAFIDPGIRQERAYLAN